MLLFVSAWLLSQGQDVSWLFLVVLLSELVLQYSVLGEHGYQNYVNFVASSNEIRALPGVKKK